VANVVVSGLATWNGKALNKAKKELNVFEKQVKNIGRTFGLTFSAAAIVGFSKKAIKAFTDDQAAAKRLELQLENTGNAFRVDEVEGYIKSLEKTNAILTDLRAPFQTFLNLTGSVELAQRSLESALDISAGTGENLTTVVSAIASGVRGQTKAIKNLNTGIDANIIASGDMNKIMEALNKRFGGQAAARLDTYAGKIDALKKGADEATKAIGQGLVESLELLGKDNSVENLSFAMENLGTDIANVIYGVALLIDKFKQFPAIDALIPEGSAFQLIPVVGTYLEFLANYGAENRTNKTLQNANERESRTSLKFTKEVVKYNRILADQLKKKTEVDKLSEKFDTERIALMKALGEATDAETKLRLQSKLAILDNNEALAKKYLAELNAAKAATDLASAFNSSTVEFKAAVETIARLKTTLPDLLARVQAGAAAKEAGTATSPADTSSNFQKATETIARLQTTLPSLLERVQTGAATFDRGDAYIPSSSMPSGGPSTTTAPVINVNVEGSLTSLQEFETTIQDLLLKIYKQNGDLAPAGFIQ
jgi:hypothetical protein